jgi:threonine synthase
MWRYEALLPIDRPEGVARAAGGTPLVRSPGLDDAAGARVFVKDEGENPTGAYKDRGSAVAVPHDGRLVLRDELQPHRRSPLRDEHDAVPIETRRVGGGADRHVPVRHRADDVVSVTDDEIRAAQRRFAVDGGFCVEPASATTLAGVSRLAERGEIAADESVVLVPTGTGFKEMGTDGAEVAAETVRRDDLRDRLESLLAP